METLKPLLEAN